MRYIPSLECIFRDFSRQWGGSGEFDGVATGMRRKTYKAFSGQTRRSMMRESEQAHGAPYDNQIRANKYRPWRNRVSSRRSAAIL